MEIKIGQRFSFYGAKLTVFLLSCDKTSFLAKYDDPNLGHNGDCSSYYYDDEGNEIDFKVDYSKKGYYCISNNNPDLTLLREEMIDNLITNYEIF